MPQRLKLENKTFGDLTVLKFHGRDKTKHTLWKCRCSCGNIKIILGTSLTSGNTKSCANGIHKVGSLHNLWKGYKEITGAQWSEYRAGARKRKIKFSITIEEGWKLFIAQERKCALSGEPLTFTHRHFRTGEASLDRKDSSLGYTKENCQWVHKDINRMKGNLLDKNFLVWCRKVYLYAKAIS